jgi:nitrite reductase (NADH) small subunit
VVEFVKVARSSDLRNRGSKLVHVEGEEIALWRAGGKIYAINNVCPHQHFSMLHQGTLDDLHVTCPMHGWTFSLENGNPRFGNGRAKTYQVKVVGEDVFVEKPESKR